MLIANEYEFGVIGKKTGLSEAEVLSHVPVLIVTRGAEGSTIALRGGQPEAPAGATTFRIPPARLRGPAVDPTGVGDAFRGGLLAARHHGLPWEVAGRVGSVAAVYTLEALGPQPPTAARGGVRRGARRGTRLPRPSGPPPARGGGRAECGTSSRRRELPAGRPGARSWSLRRRASR